ncbi:MAG TPA: class I SAM-dependent methyltransferase [Firmicutes bacterium]|jgi:16S rRNA (guanine1207-N2)-methyltransferase|nr:MAG: hypothetical protein AA931_06820 [Peptococcaceae bacterium 1109]HHT72365.1 class I SAM-dependent methyltransferase [Bacillota bacterium]
MTDHYYTQSPSSQHDVGEFQAVLRGKEYRFQTDAGVFSRQGIDKGTALLIEALRCRPGDTVLDLGCGYGPIGIAAADLVGPTGHVYLTDVNQRAVGLARQNLRLNHITNATVLGGEEETVWPPEDVDWIVTNPPIRAGKAVVYGLMDEAYNRLKPGGGLMVVIRTKQGAASLEKHLTALFGGCETIARGSGFRVFFCRKHLHS